ncbi:hypothetical protein X801_03039, partial [Opisthorchis viverrini]
MDLFLLPTGNSDSPSFAIHHLYYPMDASTETGQPINELSLPLVELFVKAAPSNPSEIAPGLLDHQWLMVLRVLEDKHLIRLRVTPISIKNPPESYIKLNVARCIPIAWIESGLLEGENAAGSVINSSGSLETLMVKVGLSYLDPKLKLDDIKEAESVFEDLYKNLMHYVRNNVSSRLLSSLTKLNQYMASKPGPYLLGPELSYADCQLMPKLQHVRVAGHAYKEFEIPRDLTHLWKYIATMYKCEYFRNSCPSDRDMLMQYAERDPLSKDFHPGLLGPGFSDAIPEDVQFGHQQQQSLQTEHKEYEEHPENTTPQFEAQHSQENGDVE